MRRVLALAVGAGAFATTLAATPASATCMEHYNVQGIVRSYSCSPPGGPVTTTTCVYDKCWSRTAGEGGGGNT